MRKLILGEQGSGKTTLIVNEIIPEVCLCGKYRVIDLCDEYFKWIDESQIIKYNALIGIGRQLKEAVIKTIRETDNETVLIFDNATLLRVHNSAHLEGEKDGGFGWLGKELAGKKYVLVFQSIENIITGDIYDVSLYDEAICFPTRDPEALRRQYLDALVSAKKQVTIRNNHN